MGKHTSYQRQQARIQRNHVSPVMRARVLAAVDELSYKPNLLAQSLRRQETLSVGFVIRDISNPPMAEIVLAAETRLQFQLTAAVNIRP